MSCFLKPLFLWLSLFYPAPIFLHIHSQEKCICISFLYASSYPSFLSPFFMLTWEHPASWPCPLASPLPPFSAPYRVMALILMTFSIMLSWLPLSPCNRHHFHPLNSCIPLAAINLWFCIKHFKTAKRLFFVALNNSDNLLTCLVGSCSRAMRGDRCKTQERERVESKTAKMFPSCRK